MATLFKRLFFYLLHDEGLYDIETSPLNCSVNQWTGFYTIGTSVMKVKVAHFCGFSEAALSNIRKFQRKYQTQSPVISSSPSQASLKIGVLKNFTYITGQHQCCSLFLIKLIKFFIKKRLQHKSFPVTFAKFLRTTFFTEHLLVDRACGIWHLIGDWIACFLCHLAINVLG